MSRRHLTVLVVGATGSIGIHVVEHAIRVGHMVRAFVRDADKARGLAPGAQVVIGDLTKPGTQWFDYNRARRTEHADGQRAAAGP